MGRDWSNTRMRAGSNSAVAPVVASVVFTFTHASSSRRASRPTTRIRFGVIYNTHAISIVLNVQDVFS